MRQVWGEAQTISPDTFEKALRAQVKAEWWKEENDPGTSRKGGVAQDARSVHRPRMCKDVQVASQWLDLSKQSLNSILYKYIFQIYLEDKNKLNTNKQKQY